MKLEPGDVALLPFPFTDLSRAKLRPTLILTPVAYNRSGPDAVAAYVTSRPQKGPWAVPFGAEDLARGKVPTESWVRVDKLATLDQRMVRKVPAKVGEATLSDVRDKLRHLLLGAA